jgi:MbtH protein
VIKQDRRSTTLDDSSAHDFWKEKRMPGAPAADEYVVVLNHEEQYSLWPTDHELPAGWEAVDKRGTKEECLAFIEQLWTDMRPLSLRREVEQNDR